MHYPVRTTTTGPAAFPAPAISGASGHHTWAARTSGARFKTAGPVGALGAFCFHPGYERLADTNEDLIHCALPQQNTLFRNHRAIAPATV